MLYPKWQIFLVLRMMFHRCQVISFHWPLSFVQTINNYQSSGFIDLWTKSPALTGGSPTQSANYVKKMCPYHDITNMFLAFTDCDLALIVEKSGYPWGLPLKMWDYFSMTNEHVTCHIQVIENTIHMLYNLMGFMASMHVSDVMCNLVNN